MADWEIIYKQITEGDFFNDGEIRDTLKPVNPRIKAKYAYDKWEQNLFGNDFITNAKIDEQNKDSLRLKIAASNKFDKRSADKITNFNPLTDNLKLIPIDLASTNQPSLLLAKTKKQSRRNSPSKTSISMTKRKAVSTSMKMVQTKALVMVASLPSSKVLRI